MPPRADSKRRCETRLVCVTVVLSLLGWFVWLTPPVGLRSREASPVRRKPGANVWLPQPPMLYGTAWKKGETADLVAAAVRAGFRAFDTACQPRHYREDLVGEGIASAAAEVNLQRRDFYLQTKFTPETGQDPTTTPYRRGAPPATQARQSLNASLHNLRTWYVDAWLLHSPLESHTATMAAWREMERLHHLGYARRLGVSNFYDLAELERLYAEAAIKPSILQNRFTRSTANFDETLRKFCRAHGIQFQAFWTLTGNGEELSRPKVQAAYDIVRAAGNVTTREQFWLRFLVDSGITPVVGPRSVNHVEHDVAVAVGAVPRLGHSALRELQSEVFRS